MPDEIHVDGLVFDAEDEYRPEPVTEPESAAWLDGSYRIGIHTTIAGDIARSLEIAKKLGCNSLQIFSASPRMWPRPGRNVIAPADAERFRAKRAELGLGPVAIHANYLINLAAAEPVARVRAIQAFRDEIVRGMALGADFLIVHPGSAGSGGDKEQASVRVGEALRAAARGLPDIKRRDAKGAEIKRGGLRVLVENTAGMGSAVGAKFEELAIILKAAGDLDGGVCVDTAHLFEAGYPVHTAEGLEQTLAEMERAIGLARVFVVHVNDSKTEFGSRVDRHEHIGKGKIGAEALGRVLRHPMLAPARLPGRAFLLETPIDAPGDDRRNVAAVWKLVGVAVEQVPGAEDGFSMLRKAKDFSRPGGHAQSRKGAKREKGQKKKALTQRAQRKQDARRKRKTRKRG
ncbi:MAG TPA: deoxyribonuclease IV [Candidatus Acidoferrum sp.]|nr:deoxyribonuclease IV [Candidatus Acidoferrum sp.]